MAWAANERTIVFDGTASLPNADPVYTPVIDRLKDAHSARDQLAIRTRPEYLPAAVGESVPGRTALAEAKILYPALLARKREYEAADRSIVDAITDPETGTEMRALYRSLHPSEQAKRVATADLAELSAITLHPEIANLAPELRAMVRDRAMLLAHIERTAMAARHPNRPSLAGEVLATGVDHDAVMRTGMAALASHRARQEQVAADEQTMRSLIAHLADLLGQTPDNVLAAIVP